MNLVVGATGRLGGEICRGLLASGKAVRALVRSSSDPQTVEELTRAGVEIAEGDVRDRSSLDGPCRGCTTVICTITAVHSYEDGTNDFESVDCGGLAQLVAAAESNGVTRFIYTSFSGHMDLDFPLRNAKRATEDLLRQSDLDYTILRPSYFMESWLSPVVGFNAAEAKATVYGTGRNPISWVSLKDVAGLAVACLDEASASRRVIEIGGPEKLTPLEAIQIFEEVSGRSFEVTHVPVEALEAQQAAAPNTLMASFTGLMRCYADGDPIDMEETLRTYPLTMKTVREFAREVLHQPS